MRRRKRFLFASGCAAPRRRTTCRHARTAGAGAGGDSGTATGARQRLPRICRQVAV